MDRCVEISRDSGGDGHVGRKGVRGGEEREGGGDSVGTVVLWMWALQRRADM